MFEFTPVEQKQTCILVRARSMYFCYYLAFGAFLPFINLYYKRLGLRGMQIGVLAAIPLVVSSMITPLWGGISDAFRLHKGILSFASLITPFAVLMLSQTAYYSQLIPLVLFYAIVSSPIIPLLDSLILELGRLHQRTFGGFRVWGSIGWIFSTLLVGTLIEKIGIRIIFYCYAMGMMLAFMLSLLQPARVEKIKSSLAHAIKGFFRGNIVVFLFSIFLVTTTASTVNSFLSIYLDEIGITEGIIGLAWAFAAATEIPVMVISGKMMERLGACGLLKISFFTYSLRWILFSFITTPIGALLVQLLHGIAFATFLVGGVTYMYQRAPEGLKTTAQAIFNSVAFGIGSIAGVLLGGYLYDLVGMVNLFRLLSIIAIISLTIFWLEDRLQASKSVIIE